MAASSRVNTVLALSSAETKALYSNLALEIPELEGTFGLNLTEIQWASIPQIREAVAYQGFDPIKVISEFMERAKKNPIQDGDKPTTYNVGSAVVSVHEKADTKTDLIFLLTLFLTRGNNVAKILLKCDPSVKPIIERKCNQYGIDTKAKVNSGPLAPSVITLSRLSQAFAPATATIILGHSILGNLRSKLFSSITLPILMTHTIFSGLVRSSDLELIEIAKFLNLETSIMLSAPKEKRKMESSDLSDLLEASESFVMAAVNGSVMPDSVKTKILIKGGILTPEGELTTPSRAMSAICGHLQSMKSLSYTMASKKIGEIMSASTVGPN